MLIVTFYRAVDSAIRQASSVKHNCLTLPQMQSIKYYTRQLLTRRGLDSLLPSRRKNCSPVFLITIEAKELVQYCKNLVAAPPTTGTSEVQPMNGTFKETYCLIETLKKASFCDVFLNCMHNVGLKMSLPSSLQAAVCSLVICIVNS